MKMDDGGVRFAAGLPPFVVAADSVEELHRDGLEAARVGDEDAGRFLKRG